MVTLLQVGKLRPWLHRAEALLSTERYQKMMSYRQEEDRLLSFGTSLLLKQGAKGKTICYTEAGKPFVYGWNFSLSHGGDYAVLAEVEADISLGVDIEKIMGPVDEWAGAALTPKEYEFVSACTNEAEKTSLFYRIWTRKESLLKCEGQGFIADPVQIGTMPLDEAHGIPYCGQIYGIGSLEWQGHMISVALAGEVPRIMIREVTDIEDDTCHMTVCDTGRWYS